MSLALYTRYLKWEGLRRIGWVKVTGPAAEHTVTLKERPPILLHLLDFWFSPEIHAAQVRDDALHPMRDPKPEEEREAHEWLDMLGGDWDATLRRRNRRA